MVPAFRWCFPSVFVPLLASIAGFLASAPADAAGVTETVTYTVGTPGTEFHAQYSWTVTNVLAKGTFVDGSPWIRVAAGSQLIAVSPMSELRATASGLLVTIHGSVKNPRMQYSINPQTLEI